MSEFHFGSGNGRIDNEMAERIHEIAQRHDATFIAVTLPGDGPRYWFSAANLGSPFDQATAKAVTADLEAAGLARDGKLAPKCFVAADDEAQS
jgi:hypothetical protein